MVTGAGPHSREIPLVAADSALLLIDVQNYCCHPDGGLFRGHTGDALSARFGYYLERLREQVLPNLVRLLGACRERRVEVIHTTIEALTADGRERSLDYTLSGILVPGGSWDAAVVEPLAPHTDEMRLPKGASSVFNATNLDFLLRNLGVRQLVIAGVLTDQCVESAVRDACDLGYLVTLVVDGCATLSPARDAASRAALAGYCRQRTTQDLLTELAAPDSRADGGPR
jgi:ureidoacrylate peracid hydrolase